MYDIKTTVVYKEVIKDLKRINCLRGSARSGKTHSLLQMAIRWLWEGKIGKKSIPSGVAIIARETFPSLRRSVLREFIDLLREYNLLGYIEYRKTTHEFQYKNRMIFFLPLDEESKILGMQTAWFWINEGNNVKFSLFNQLLMRCENFCFLDYNPFDEDGWINKEIELKRLPNRQDVNLTISTFRQNPYLPEAIVKEIEELYHTDRQLYEVYANDNWMRPQGLIFPKYEVVPRMPEYYEFESWGLDWGFEDPNVLVHVRKQGTNLYIDQLIFKNQLLVNELATMINGLGIPKIYGDSKSPGLITEMRYRGVPVRPAKQYKGSVIHGINKIRQHHVHITNHSIETMNEFKKYVWATNRSTGEFTIPRAPIEAFDHAIKAIIYAISHIMNRKIKF